MKKKNYNHFSLDEKKKILERSKNNLESTNNPFYSPLLDNNISFFSENDIDILFTNNKEKIQSLKSKEINIIQEKLKSFKTIDQSEIKLITNKKISFDNLITNMEDEIREGELLINWIKNNFLLIFKDLELRIHSGYVIISRKGISLTDKINKNLIKLKYFKWQYNKPIDYHTLKYVLFQNKNENNIKQNIYHKKEAEKILSQEYIIALQPDSSYLLWSFKRLLMIWYSEKKLESNIRKIKLLINSFRANPDKNFNLKNGILPQILIYPKYGSKNAREIISILEYYFSLYVDEDKTNRYSDISWFRSWPTYFVKKNSLIYYTNGAIDLKNYFKFNKFENNMFTQDLSELKESNKILSV